MYGAKIVDVLCETCRGLFATSCFVRGSLLHMGNCEILCVLVGVLYELSLLSFSFFFFLFL